MQAYVLNAVGQLDLMEVERPVLKPGEVLVKVHAAGICGSDIPRIFKTGTYHFPTIPGHEFAGEVVEASDDEIAKKWVGKRVGVFPLIPCMECAPCKDKLYEMCQHYNYLGSRCDGGFAEYVAVPAWNLIALPDAMSYEEAAMLEPTSVGLHAVRRLDLTHVHSVALLGLGTIGGIIAQWLHYYGVETVYATGHGSDKGVMMQKTSSPGYHYLDTTKMDDEDVLNWILGETDRKGVDVVIDCVNAGRSLSDALELVKAGGQILVVGNPAGDLAVEKTIYWKLLRKQIRMTGTWNSSFTHEEEDDWHVAIQACVEGKIHLKELITHCYAFEDLPEGLEVMRMKKPHNKVMVWYDY